MKKLLTCIIMFLSSFCYSQNLIPKDVEIQTLAKLKERVLRKQAEQQALEANITAFQQALILKKQEIIKANSDLMLKAEDVKNQHIKDWGPIKDVNYNPIDSSNGQDPTLECGVFTKINKEDTNGDKKENVQKNGGQGHEKEKSKKIKEMDKKKKK